MQIPGSKRFDAQIAAHTETQNDDISLALEFQNHQSNASHKNGIFDNGKHKKGREKKYKQGVSYTIQ